MGRGESVPVDLHLAKSPARFWRGQSYRRGAQGHPAAKASNRLVESSGNVREEGRHEDGSLPIGKAFENKGNQQYPSLGVTTNNRISLHQLSRTHHWLAN